MEATALSIQNWLYGELATSLAAAFEALTGHRPQAELAGQAEVSAETGLRWRQEFSGISGAIWIAASEPNWTAAGASVLHTAGVEESDPAKLKPEYLKILRQALSGAAAAISARLGRETLAVNGEESSAAPPPDACWSSIEVRLGAATASFAAGIEAELAGALADRPQIEAAPAAQGRSSTFDLLLDVELPVSISFGRAQVPLKDVLKLTTGSIVELNRAIGDPVEIIVNNCVIARGEVVVVEGNFGVRIEQVISRQERLRTLK